MASNYMVHSALISPQNSPLQSQKVLLCLLENDQCVLPHVIILEATDRYIHSSTVNDGEVQVKRCQLEMRAVPKPHSFFTCTFNAKPIRMMKIPDASRVPNGGMRAYLVGLSNQLITLPPRASKRFVWKMERIAPPTSKEKEAMSEDENAY